MSSEQRRNFPCIICSKRTKQHERRPLCGANNKHLRKYIEKTFLVNCRENDVLCGRCRREYYTNRNHQGISGPKPVVQPEAKSSMEFSPKNITLPLPSIGGSHSTCCVCKKRGPKLIVVSSKARFNCFLYKNVIIPYGSRCCPVHIADDMMTEEAVNVMNNFRQNTNFNRTDIMNLLGKVREALLKKDEKGINFDSTFSDTDIKNLTGLNRAAFENLLTYLSSIRDTQVRSARTCLGIYLTKLKTGLSNKILATLFQVSRDSIRRAIKSVRKNLLQTFTPHHIGFEHVTREDLIRNHTRPLAQTLFGQGLNPAILVLDGTYIYIQKSSQFRFQRRSYNLHKHRPLIKMMVVVSTSGYFVSVIGPYLSDAQNNDAKILKHMFAHDKEEIVNWVKDGDIFVVDRGFRDSVDFLSDIGIKTEMPAFLKKGQKQLDTEESNTSRLVTKVRWVVESANARLKSWKYFDRVLPNTLIPFVGDDISIAAALCNKYLPALSTEKDDDEAIGCKMLHLSRLNNDLQIRVERDNLDKIRGHWQKIDAADINFPAMTEEEIRGLAIGVYQVGLAKSYVQEHFNENSEFEVMVNQLDPHLICAKLQSRHVSSKSYLLWIMFDEVHVTSWYCRCRTGSRVVGMCAHIASVLWYLAYARHLTQPFAHINDWTKHMQDAKDLPQPEEIDDSDSSDDGCIEE